MTQHFKNTLMGDMLKTINFTLLEKKKNTRRRSNVAFHAIHVNSAVMVGLRCLGRVCRA